MISFEQAFTYLKSTMETTGQSKSGVFIVNVGQISHINLVFLLLTLNK